MKSHCRGTLLGLVVAIIVALGQSASAAISTQDLSTQTPAQIASVLVGAGVSISNVAYTGATNSAGTFTGGTGIIGFEHGVILSTGDIANVIGPNLEEGKSTSLDLPGDDDLTALSGFDTFDATVLEFDFVPNANKVFFQYTFASDEYNEFVNTEFNDVFAFFINGVNCATVGGLPVSINTINNGNPFGTPPNSHPELYINNDLESGADIDTEMDGLTVLLTCQADVTPNMPNHMKLAIADATDTIYDANVFLRPGSLTTTLPPMITSHPASQTIGYGATAAMNVSAVGSGLSYQWYVGTSGNTTNAVGGATSDSYSTPALFGNRRYWVRVSNATASTDSNTAAITVAFTDSPLVSGTTVIRAVHIIELRNRINALRVAHALSPVTWPPMTAGVTPILASNILQMRQALLDVYNAPPPRPAPIYSTNPVPGGPVVVADIAELRTAVMAIE
jgi:hypothetical protein